MIKLTRLNGEEVVVNAELIRFVESRPDTHVTLTTNDRLDRARTGGRGDQTRHRLCPGGAVLADDCLSTWTISARTRSVPADNRPGDIGAVSA